MDMEELLRQEEPAILDEAGRAIARIERYRRDGEQAVRRRVKALYRQVVRAVRTRDLDELLAHVRAVARERFEAGYLLDELQTAFSTLEEAIRREALARLPASELAWGLGLTDTALAHAKLALGRAFTSPAPRADAPSVDLTALFRRSDPGFEGRTATDLVYPV